MFEIAATRATRTPSPAAAAGLLAGDHPTNPPARADSAAQGSFDVGSVEQLAIACASMPAALLPASAPETQPRRRGRWTPAQSDRDRLSEMLEGMNDYGA